ncbi:thiol:disulfide interchange protein DsbA/DsbL [Plasticicumulans sp.]|uniref:thiol:disulfide interchange protein DsbA/DsbL n=1 Tax=Plasticicumulans sp. TaxID=2307179 RepID=UPI0039545622
MPKFPLIPAVLLAFACALLPATASADEAPAFKEGTEYTVLKTPVATSTAEQSGKVEVVELFWFGCPHCYRLEPAIQEWLKARPEEAVFVRVPAALAPNWELGARAYYAALSLDVEDKLHQPLFDAIHKDRKLALITDENALVSFAGGLGIDAEAYRKALHSFDVETRLRKSKQLVVQYRVTGVPAVIVAGKYVTDIAMAGSPARVMDVVNFLVRKESGKSGS